MTLSKGEETLALHLKAEKIEFEREFKFHPERRWKADFYIPEKRLLVEIEGGVWLGAKGGHTSAKGYTSNLEKYNAATILSYSLLRYTTEQVVSGMAITQIKEFLWK